VRHTQHYPISYNPIMNPKDIVNDLLRQMSQVRLAQRLECTQAAVSMWSSGKRVPGGVMLMKIIELAKECSDGKT
jgi:predicted transcriptional regulator